MSTAANPANELSAEEKRARLAELLRKKARAPKTYPLSFSQQRVWFLYQLDRGNPAYNMAAAFQLEVPLSQLKPGWYTCQVNVIDDAGGTFAFPRLPILVR